MPRFTVCSSAVVSNMEERERKSVTTAGAETVPAAGPSTPLVPEHDPEAERKDGGAEADKIDVCSEKFDPLLALYSPTVSVPFPNIKCFNNVAEYESFLRGGRGRAKPENVEKKRLKAMKGVADPERIERLKRLMVKSPLPESGEGESSGTPRSRRRQKPQKNVLTRMPLCKGSPLGELYRCVEERIRVKVHIRTFKGLRGVCSGFVVAFDKFWNMAMVDVDETYREPLLGEAFYHEKALTISRLFEKLKLQESSGGDEPAKKLEAKEQASKHQPENPKATRTSRSSHPTSSRGESRTESMLSDAVKTSQDKHKVSLKAQGPEGFQKNNSQPYGKVHTRHINQLFIRGESVVLVNPQPL
ncbi:U7 snRNA-associated Sm-like protein LSm11 [Trachinotus anak]|uniref:U7 snRNA-associated Sm-like protein LSm11 n=1 Tax=Trachinotus anak TaxID=443729 RepID=UPI0039F22781